MPELSVKLSTGLSSLQSAPGRGAAPSEPLVRPSLSAVLSDLPHPFTSYPFFMAPS